MWLVYGNPPNEFYASVDFNPGPSKINTEPKGHLL